MVETKTTKKGASSSKKKVETKVVETEKVENKQSEKIMELKIELLKQGSKKRDIRREIARLLTLQNKTMGENKK